MLEFTGASNKRNVRGGSGATATFTCEMSEWGSMRDLLLRSIFDDDTQLGCEEVSVDYLGKDAASGMMTLTATYIPLLKLQWTEKDTPYHIRYDEHAEAITIAGDLFWADGTPLLNRQAKPSIRVLATKLILFGTRSSSGNYNFVGQSTLDALDGMVNDGDFCGYPKDTVLFHSYSANPRPYDDGSQVWDVQGELLVRSLPWTQFWREDTGAFEELHKGSSSGDLVYSEASFEGLLT